MKKANEITALLKLMDDPDHEVFDTVAGRLAGYGAEIIPRLEQLWQVSENEELQERIMTLIHRVQFSDLQSEITSWRDSKNPELLRGGILSARYRFPELNVPELLTRVDQMRRNIWLELNNYMTPLEQINICNSILYNYYKLQGHELTERNPDHFCINHTLESRQGNAYTIGILYLSICELLDIPVFAMRIPRQFILGYMDTMHPFFPEQATVRQIQFFVDPLNGMVYTQQDVNAYLRKINAPEGDDYYTPLSSVQIIESMLQELALCYRHRQEEERAVEVGLLKKLLENKG